jgi:hypothetical protein
LDLDGLQAAQGLRFVRHIDSLRVDLLRATLRER